MLLFRQLLLTEGVEDIELAGEIRKALVSDRAEFDLHDDLSIGHHHSYRSEQDLKWTQSLGGVQDDPYEGIKCEHGVPHLPMVP